MLIETLAGVLTGAMVGSQVKAWMTSNPSLKTGHGAAFIAIDIGAMMPIEQFKQRVDALAGVIHSSPLAVDAERIYLPGEIEQLRRQEAERDGILLPPDVAQTIAALATDIGITPAGRDWQLMFAQKGSLALALRFSMGISLICLVSLH